MDLRILFVEDNANFASTVIRLFLSAHEVTVAPTLKAARIAIAANAFECVILDYDLPDGKGIELLGELKALSPRPRIIAASAFDENNAAMLRAGADTECGKLRFHEIASKLA
jgi:DNA-binding response OmpR family regulator